MGVFKRIFSKKEEIIDPIDISFLKNDIHSHLIPRYYLEDVQLIARRRTIR